MKKTLSTMAAAAVLMASTAIAPAMAQTADPAAPAAPTDSAPADATPAAPTDSAPTDAAPAAPADDAAPADPAMPADPAPAPDAAAPSDAATPSTDAAGGDAYLTEQSTTQVSANDYIGKTVYNSADESIGKVTDLIMEEDGGIVAAIIGVGGFLGIGQKVVAVPMDTITMTLDAENNNQVRLTTTETAESLKAAPEFKTLADQQAEAEAEAVTPAAPATDAPAPMAPAPN